MVLDYLEHGAAPEIKLPNNIVRRVHSQAFHSVKKNAVKYNSFGEYDISEKQIFPLSVYLFPLAGGKIFKLYRLCRSGCW